MNTSLLAGLGVGSGIVIVGLVAATLVMPPTPESLTPPQVAPASEAIAEPASELPETAEIAEPEPERAPEPEPEPIVSETPEPTEEAVAEPIAPEPEIEQTELTVPAEDPAGSADLAEDPSPTVPLEEPDRAETRLPEAGLPLPASDTALRLPESPPAQQAEAQAPRAIDPPADETVEMAQPEPTPPASLPDPRPTPLPQITAADPAPAISDDVPDATTEAATTPALQRNALFQGDRTRPRMAVVLDDPGLPRALRETIAALDFPFTVALNPLDTTAAEAAEIYRASGKEILILATSIPDGASASDLDVTFDAFFSALPMAVGVIDLPQSGFARNARLLNEILPILRNDGHGLVTFSGGLSQAGRAAEAAGVPHAEVFRVIDSGNESAFTMRRFLDRAMFQASQIGEVVVFGDASNDVFMEALEMWRAGRMLDQVALVQISGVLPQPE